MSDHDSKPQLGHVLPLGLLLKVFLTLTALTILTVWTGRMDLHGFDLSVALIIATVKVALVCAFFMHLKYDRSFHGMIFLFSVLMLGLFLAFLALDSTEYQADIRAKMADDLHAIQVDE